MQKAYYPWQIKYRPMNEKHKLSPTIYEEHDIDKKITHIVDYLSTYTSMLVAFSGGVDSSTLAALAYRALGKRAAAVTADSQTLPRRELESSKKTAQSIGIEHFIIPYNEMEEPEFAQNPVDRCYYCKRGLFRSLTVLARELGFDTIADGTNASELTGHRPGHKAALEYGICTPFADLGITKEEIRTMARILGLSMWDKPTQACLATRFPYGRTITSKELQQIEKAEVQLYNLGIGQCRVRHHDDVARIEVPPHDFMTIMKNKKAIIKPLKELGYTYITLDLEGFRSGSMNEGH